MRKEIFTIILLCLTVTSSDAITREAAVQYALENSESFRMNMETSEAMREQGRGVAAFTEPRFSLSGGYTRMGDNREDNPYSASPDKDVSVEVTASKLLFAGGRIENSRYLGENFRRQADIQEQTGKRDIQSQVWMAFDAVLYQKAALDIQKDRLKQRQAEIEDAQDLKEAGMVTSLDVRQSKLNLHFAQDELKSGEALYENALTDFNLSIGRPENEDPQIPEGDLRKVPELKMIMSRLEASLSQNDFLDMQSVQARADAAKLNFEIAEGEDFPEVAVAASGKSNGEKLSNMDESWTLGIQVNWNIFDGGLVQAKSLEAKANMRKADENLTRTRKALAGDVEKIGVNLRSLEQRIRLQQEAVELSRENYEDARGHYRAGTITLTRLGEFNLSYAEARFNLLRLFFLQRQEQINAESLLEK